MDPETPTPTTTSILVQKLAVESVLEQIQLAKGQRARPPASASASASASSQMDTLVLGLFFGKDRTLVAAEAAPSLWQQGGGGGGGGGAEEIVQSHQSIFPEHSVVGWYRVTVHKNGAPTPEDALWSARLRDRYQTNGGGGGGGSTAPFLFALFSAADGTPRLFRFCEAQQALVGVEDDWKFKKANTMEDLRPYVQKTIGEAKRRKEGLKQEALLCHDCIAARERDVAVLQREAGALREQMDRLDAFQLRGIIASFGQAHAMLQQNIAARQQEIISLRQQMTRLVAKIKQENWILAFDPERDGDEDDLYKYRALNAWSVEQMWRKDVIITVHFCYFTVGKRVPPSFWEENWNDEAPEFIKRDRDIALARVTVANPYLCGSLRNGGRPFPIHIPDVFLADKVFLLTAAKWNPLVLRSIPKRSLNDTDVFLAYTATKFVKDGDYDGYTPWWECDELRPIVTRFSDEILSNTTLMLNLVKKCGLFLEFIDKSVDGYLAIAQAAGKQTIDALEHCAPEAKTALLNNKAYVLDLLNLVPVYLKFARELFYEDLPESMKQDVDILGAARISKIDFDDIPPVAFDTDDPKFWLVACGSLDRRLWSRLPVHFRSRPEFVAAFRFRNVKTYDRVLQDCPELVGDHTFWTSVLKSPGVRRKRMFRDLIRDDAPEEIRQDRDLMLFACQQEAKVYGVLGDRLQEDREILFAACDDKYDFDLGLIPERVQVMHPDLTAQAIKAVGPRADGVDMHEIAEELWSNADVMKAFLDLCLGRRFLYDANGWDLGWEGGSLNAFITDQSFPESMKDNKDIALYAAKYCTKPTHFEAVASKRLRSDKEFMLKVVQSNPYCLGACVGKLANDLELAFAASSHPINEQFQFFREDDFNEYDQGVLASLHSIAVKARERVVAFEGFTQGFLFGLLVDNPGPNCHLPMISDMKDVIAEFAGVPLAKDVGRLRAASLNLLFVNAPEKG